jgi:allantoin racemase
MRLVWHTIVPTDSGGRLRESEPLWALMRDYVSRVVDPETTVEFMFMNPGTRTLAHPYAALANERWLVIHALAAERGGADGFLTAYFGDLGLETLQSALQIPVVGSLQSALAVAANVGRRVGIATVHPGYVHHLELAIQRYGGGGRLVDHRPVRYWPMNWQEEVGKALDGQPDQLFAAFTAVANTLIADGADVIIGVGQIFGAVLAKYDVRVVGDTGVPIVDIGASGLKMLELMASLRKTIGLRKSEAIGSPLRTLSPDLFAAATEMLRSEA